jgi:hypothetical protein
MGTACVYSWSDMGAITGLAPDNFPNSLSSGIQVHEPWIVIWGTSDTSILPSFFTEIPDGATLEWWDPTKGEYEEATEEDDTSSSGSERSDMDRYGFAILGSLLGVLVLLFICMVTCCRKRITRHIRQDAGLPTEATEGERSNYASMLATQSQRDASTSRRSRSARSRVSEQQPRMEERPAAREPHCRPPAREPTPPPPYANEDNERWQTSNDNPNRRRNGEA